MSGVSNDQRPESGAQTGSVEGAQIAGLNAATNSSLQPQPDNAANPTSMSGETRSRPIFKMRRTGHSGMFPFTAGPSLPSPSSEDIHGAAPQPASHSSPPSSGSPPRKRRHVAGAESSRAAQNRRESDLVVVSKARAQPDAAAAPGADEEQLMVC